MWPRSSFTTPAVAAISFCLIGGTSPAAADIIHVPGDFLTIQEAIDAAMDGDEVEVHPGSYNEAIDFLGKAIIVHSSDGPDVTTIDATGLNTSVVSCVNLEGSDSVLDGFTVTGGNAVQGGGMLIELSDPCVLNCIFVTNQATRGGGVYCRVSSPVFRDCVFSSNTATDGLQDGDGGGMYCVFSSNAKLTDCVFEDNFALDDGGGIANISNSHTLFTTCVFTANTADRGGGIFNVQSDPIIIGSTFANNMAIGKNAGLAHGGAIYNSGSQPTIQDCAFDGNSAVSTGSGHGWGGAIYNLNSFSPIVTSCVFRRNLASGGVFGGLGGAMFNRNSHPVVSDCDFIENSVVNTAQSGNNAYGGAIFNRNGSSPIVTNCRFIANAAEGVFSAISRRGGAIYNDVGDTSPILTDCSFIGNTAGTNGGAIYTVHGDPILTRCTFEANVALRGSSMYNKSGANPTVTNCKFVGNITISNGGIYNDYSSPTLTNCLFSGNTAATFGAGIFNSDNSHPTIMNCTFSKNDAFDGAAIYNFGIINSPTIANCIMWGNTVISGHPSIGGSGTPTVTYSDVQGGWPGEGNIDADPLFVDPENDDYHLSPGSPSIDAGNNWGVPVDANDYDEDGVLCELFPVDLDGSPRFNADEADFDPGCGVPVVVDMGAYEYQFDPADQVTFADLNGDNAVGAADLLGILASWGSCGKGCCLADLDLDGSVGASDLLALLVNWGPCP